jgi:ribonuclease M5
LLKIEQVIIVEGKYDKIKLSSIVDAVIIQTDGYKIFKDKEKLELIRYYAEKKGIIIMTDSDTAGFKIRNYLKGSVSNYKDKIKNVYIPDIFGKEKRKLQPSAEGKLGVEGVSKKIILAAFEKAGVITKDNSDKKTKEPITRYDLYELGLNGKPNSSELRKVILKELNLPEILSTTGVLELFNVMFTREEFFDFVNEIIQKRVE